jgi:tRNA nucleotidyltransferase (CCA-adding enzyme)
MEVTSVELRDAAGNTTKVAASQSVGQYIRTLATTDPAAWSAYQTLKKAGGQVYVVGGAVRDALLQREPKDIDLMVAGLPPEEVEHALSKVKGSVNLTGKKFGVYRYNTGGSEVEIALPRQDKYESGRRGEGQITVDHTLPIKKDLERRDFTVNSMAVNLDNGQLIDPFGGAKDIERKTLRTTHPSSFEEDPTRLVRALVASSRHGLVPDERTRREMTENASKLGGESPDITGRELDKLFQSPNPAGAIRLAQETGVLHQLLPELAHNFDFDQNNPHHNFSLGDHSLNVLDHISRNSTDPDLRLAALLHDVGKPNSAWVDPVTGYNHYYEGPNHQGADHETLGAQMVGDRLRQLRYPNSRIHRIQSLVEQHMWPAFNTPKGARKFLNRVGDNADDLLALRNADVDGKGNDIGVIAPDGGITDVERMRGLVEQSRSAQDPTQQSALSINGNDILGLGVPPGPQVGQVLRNLTNDVIDDPTLNQRDTLLQRAKEYANAQPVQQGVV